MKEVKFSSFPKLTNLDGNILFPVIKNESGLYINYIADADEVVDYLNDINPDDYYNKNQINSLVKSNLGVYMASIYKSSQTIPALSNFEGDYNFDTLLFSVPNGWTTSMDRLEAPIWYSFRLFYRDGTSSKWSSPVRLILSSSEVDNSIQSAQVAVYYSSKLLPLTPQGGTFNFTIVNGKFSGFNAGNLSSGWVLDNKDLKNPIWVSYNTFYSNNTSTGWSTPAKFVNIDEILASAKELAAELSDNALERARLLNSDVTNWALQLFNSTREDLEALGLKVSLDGTKIAGITSSYNELSALVAANYNTLNDKITKISNITIDEDLIRSVVSQQVTSELGTVNSKLSAVELKADSINTTVESLVDGQATQASNIELLDDRISMVVTKANGEDVLNSAAIIAGINENDSSYINLKADTITAAGLLIADEVAAKGLNIDNLTYINGHDAIKNNPNAQLMTVGAGTDGETRFNKDGSGQLAGGAIRWNNQGKVTFGDNVVLGWGSGNNLPSGDGDYDYTELASRVSALEQNGGNGYSDAEVLAYLKQLGVVNEDGSVNSGELAGYLKAGDIDSAMVAQWLANGDRQDLTTYIDKNSIITEALGASKVFAGTVYADKLQMGANDATKVFVDAGDGKIKLGSKVKIEWNNDWNSNVNAAAGNYSNTDVLAYLKDLGLVNEDGSISSADLAEYMKTSDYDAQQVATWLASNPDLTTYIDGNSIVTGYLAANKITAGQINADDLSVKKINGLDVTSVDWASVSNGTIKGANGDITVEGTIHAKGLVLESGVTIPASSVDGITEEVANVINSDETLSQSIETAINNALDGFDGGEALTLLSNRVAANETALLSVYTKAEVDSAVATAQSSVLSLTAESISSAVGTVKTLFDEKLGNYVKSSDYNSKIVQTENLISAKVSLTEYNSNNEAVSTRIGNVETTANNVSAKVLTIEGDYVKGSDLTLTDNKISAVVAGLSLAGIDINVEDSTGSIELFADTISISDSDKSKLITVNGSTGAVSLNSKVSLSWDSNISGKPSIPTKLSLLTNDSNFLDSTALGQYLTDNGYKATGTSADGTPADITNWLATNPDLTTYIDADSIVTSTAIANSVYAGKINASSITTGKLDASKLTVLGLVVGSNVTMGENASISWSNVSSRPTKLSAFTNDSGFLTATLVNTIINGKGFLTSDSLAGYMKSSDYNANLVATWLAGLKSGDLNTYIDANTLITSDVITSKLTAGSITASMIDASNLLVAAANITGDLVAKNIKLAASNPLWALNADGTGLIAGNNILWNASGEITFSDNVKILFATYSLNATPSAITFGRDANDALTPAGMTAKVSVISTTAAETKTLDNPPTGYTIYYGFDNDTPNTLYSSTGVYIANSSAKTLIVFVLKKNSDGKILSTVTVPITKLAAKGNEGATWKPEWVGTSLKFNKYEGITPIEGQVITDGPDLKGATGDTWKPSVDTSTGKLTWTKDSSSTVPSEAIIKGEKGDTWKPTVSAAGELQWALSSDSTTPASVNIKGDTGNSVKVLTIYVARNVNNAPGAPTSIVTATGDNYGNWTLDVPSVNTSYPYYFKCIQTVTTTPAGSSTGSWTTPVKDSSSFVSLLADSTKPLTTYIDASKIVTSEIISNCVFTGELGANTGTIGGWEINSGNLKKSTGSTENNGTLNIIGLDSVNSKLFVTKAIGLSAAQPILYSAILNCNGLSFNYGSASSVTTTNSLNVDGSGYLANSGIKWGTDGYGSLGDKIFWNATETQLIGGTTSLVLGSSAVTIEAITSKPAYSDGKYSFTGTSNRYSTGAYKLSLTNKGISTSYNGILASTGSIFSLDNTGLTITGGTTTTAISAPAVHSDNSTNANIISLKGSTAKFGGEVTFYNKITPKAYTISTDTSTTTYTPFSGNVTVSGVTVRFVDGIAYSVTTESTGTSGGTIKA